MHKADLQDLIDWPGVLAAPRYAGGHEDVMRAIFGSNAEVAAWWSDNDYQGQIAIAYEFPDGSVAVMTDYYGSCSGCDSWEGASDSSAKDMVSSLVGSARLLPSLDEAIAFCKSIEGDPAQYPMKAAVNLVEELQKRAAKQPKAEAYTVAELGGPI